MPDFDTITIEEATDRLIDYRGKTPPKTDSGVRLITAKVVKGGQILEEPKEFISAGFYDEWMRRGLPEKFDVLLTTEAPLGEVAVLRDSERIALAQRIILLRAKPGRVDPLFLFYALQSDFGQGELKARASGTTVLGIKQSELRQVRIPIFPLPVQRWIAGILSAYDELIENNLRRIRILEDMARSHYREWFVHFRFPGHENVSRVDSKFGPIPQGWEVATIDDVCECVTDGSHFSPTSVEDGVSMASSKDMHNWGLDLKTCRKISLEDFDQLVRNGCRPKKNDILVTKDGANYLKHIFVVRTDLDIVLLSSIAILRPSQRINPHLLCAILTSDENRERLKRYVTGAAIPRIILKDFKRFQILLPTKAIQLELANVSEKIAEFCWNLVDQIHNLRRTRDLLLPQLLSGTIYLSDTDALNSSDNDEAIAEPVMATQRSWNRGIFLPGEFTCSSSGVFPAVVEIGATTGGLAPTQVEDQSELEHQQPPFDETDRSDVFAVIRQVFNDGHPRTRQDAIRQVAQTLGYGRVGHRIQDVLHTDLLTAVRRGILDNVEDELILLARSIADYDRDLLKRQFLAAVGRSWIERDQAIQNFCRWMGFRRTGPIIDETARSLIQGLLRESRLEADGPNLIRRSS
jgi:type I restriction enzyme, S subunit